MKKFLLLVTISLLSACASKPTANNTTQNSNKSSPSFEQAQEEIVLADDAHSKDIYTVLRAIKVLDLVMLGFETEFNKQIEQSPEKTEYFTCAKSKMSEKGLLQLMTPVYKKYVSSEQAQKLAQILSTPEGAKFAQVMRSAAGLNEQMPQMTAQDINTMTPYLKDFQQLGAAELQQELQDAGANYGLQLGLSCANTLIED